MLLSINIPTYNRAHFLKKNLNILIQQILSLGVMDDVEINISDNASTDDTQNEVLEIIKSYPTISIHYSANDKNYGGEVNLITAMHMANGEYSLLLGDDDFLKEDGLGLIFRYLKQFDYIPMFLFNRTDVASDGKYLREKVFLRDIDKQEVFDFSLFKEGKLFFSLATTLGGVLSFTSSVLYKTSILKEIGKFDERFYGTYYPFHYYWWGYLLKGKKLMYVNDSFLNCTVGTYNDDLGSDKVNRKMVDFGGFNKIAKMLFKDTPYYSDYINSPFKDADPFDLIYLYCYDTKNYLDRLLPYLKEAGWSEKYTNKFISRFSILGLLKLTIRSLISYLKNKR